MSGRQRLGAELARGREQIRELDLLVAQYARHRRLARDVALDERLDHGGAEALLVVEHVMRDAELCRDQARVVDVVAGAAGALAGGGGAMVVELQRDADHVVAGLLQQRRHDRGIHPARHGDHDPRVLRAAVDVEIEVHRRSACSGPAH